VPVGYQRARSESTAERSVARSTGFGDLMDDYEFHYPTSSAATTSTRSAPRSTWDLLPGQRAALIRLTARGLSSPDDAIRDGALRVAQP
jgi:hypothetical protein